MMWCSHTDRRARNTIDDRVARHDVTVVRATTRFGDARARA